MYSKPCFAKKYGSDENFDVIVNAEKGDLDNSGGGEKTAKLEEKKVNKVTIIIQ